MNRYYKTPRTSETGAKFQALMDIAQQIEMETKQLQNKYGFDKESRLIGTKTEMKKYIGNAVEVTMARVLCEALANKINQLRKVA